MSTTGRSAVRRRHAYVFDFRHRVQAGRESANRGAFLTLRVQDLAAQGAALAAIRADKRIRPAPLE
jgi:hypothetical protein